MKKTGVIYHNGYYRISKRLRVLKYVTLLLLLLFSLLLFMAFRQDMTLNHFRYLLRNFDFSPNAASTSGDTIYYNGDSEATFGFVSGGFATVTDTRVFVTDRSSSTTFSLYHGYREPRGVFSDTFMLLYDRKGSSLTVYNAFSAVKTMQFDGTVCTAALADNGTFAVAVAEDNGYYTTVYVYDRSFRLVNTLSKYKYTTALSFSDSGTELLVGSRYTDKDGKNAYELLLLGVGDTAAKAEVSLRETVYAAAVLEDGSFAALTASEALFYHADGSLDTSYTLVGVPHKSLIGRQGILTLTSSADKREETLMYYTPTREAHIPLSAKAVSFGEDDGYLYLLSEDTLWLYRKTDGALASTAVPVTGAIMLVSDSSRVYLATTFRADRLDGEALFGKNPEKDTET
ncbi:MAG: hypothetical protein IJW46_02825 [Clostridia bacterium]|nr:hypothetical protein [Clostridia bacterium]